MRPPRPASGSASGRSAPADRARRRASDFAQRLIIWQRIHGRHDLPWQGAHDAYRIWLSEIMLQQTQVATVLPYYARFTARFPDVAALARAPLSQVLELWSGLGYYRRAHHLHAAARAVVAENAGIFPSDAATLATLPGIGRSTAAAIAAFASGERGAILDGNVKRVLARHRGIDGWPGVPAVEAKLWRIAEDLLPRQEATTADVTGGAPPAQGAIADYSQALMDLGATVCTRLRPHCNACPVASDCIARRERRTDALPSPRPRKPLPRRAICVLILERDGHILLERRPPLGIWAGLWSFPEMPVDADPGVVIAARFGVIDTGGAADTASGDGTASATGTAGGAHARAAIRHAFTHFVLTMHPLRVPIVNWPEGAQAPGIEWFTRDAAIAAAVPAPIRKLLARL